MSGVRLLTPSDVPQAMLLKQAAGWNQTEADWLRVLELEPEGCFGIEREGRLAATATAVCYGNALAWIGMVLTAAEFRGQGLATRLMTAALEFLDGRRVAWTKLDATSMGIGIYRKLGFVEERAVERWERAPAPAPPVSAGRYEFDAALDRRAFGVDRAAVLSRLARVEAASIPAGGFAMGRPGSNSTYFGPCVAVSPSAARNLLGWFLANHHEERVCWDIFPENADAVSLAREFGFERRRELVRMARRGPGDSPPPRDSIAEIYAISSFEFG